MEFKELDRPLNDENKLEVILVNKKQQKQKFEKSSKMYFIKILRVLKINSLLWLTSFNQSSIQPQETGHNFTAT